MTGLGFVGLGWLGESLLKELPHTPSLRVKAVQDARLDLAEAFAQRFASPWFGDRFEDLLDQPGVDAVVICTPNSLHVGQAQAALRAGKHVLVQKPLALSHAEAQATVEMARRLERLLFVDYTYRFVDTMRVFRSVLDDAGSISSVRAVFHNIYGPGVEKAWFFDPKQSGGGALTDLGVHLLDLALWVLTPGEVRLVSAELSSAQERPTEDSARLELDLDTVPCEVSVSWHAPRSTTEIAFEVQTQRGLLRWENVEGSFFHFRTRLNERTLIDRETTLRDDTLRVFAAALATGAAPPIDVRVYALLDQAYGRAV